jgi:molybdopterin-biosynthesis enzyme MoeA-like protein
MQGENNDARRQTIGAIIIGDEITRGKRADGHFPRLKEILDARGMHLDWAMYLGDDRQRLIDTFRRTFASDDLVFSFGGIGNTPDDHTRQAAAAAAGIELVLHPVAEHEIRSRFIEMRREMTIESLDMGRFPASARIIPNPYNQIPGFACGHVHFLPGFPVMAWPMMASVLDGPDAHLHGSGALAERAVVVRGAMESTLTPLMQEIERRFAGVKVFSLPSVDHPEYGRHIELGVKGDAKSAPAAFDAMMKGLDVLGASTGPLLVR